MQLNNIAIIPARGGSKRISGKNIKEFCGKPIIAYSIEAAIASNLFKEVMVSTDDDAIATIAIQYNAKVPFMRSAKNADDYATTFDVLKEVIQLYKNQNKHFEHACCIYSAAPFVNGQLLKSGYEKLVNEKFDTVFPTVKYAHSIWRSYKIENDKATMLWPENLNTRSQDLSPAYHDAGQFYWFNIENVLKAESLITKNSGVIVVDDMMVQDIDTLADWQLAELKYQLLNNKVSG